MHFMKQSALITATDPIHFMSGVRAPEGARRKYWSYGYAVGLVLLFCFRSAPQTRHTCGSPPCLEPRLLPVQRYHRSTVSTFREGIRRQCIILLICQLTAVKQPAPLSNLRFDIIIAVFGIKNRVPSVVTIPFRISPVPAALCNAGTASSDHQTAERRLRRHSPRHGHG